MTLTDRVPTASSRSLVTLGACVVVLTVALTWTYLVMRSVMDVGGACAEGGPYEIAQPCPGGVWMIAVGVPVMIVAAMTGSAVAMGLSAPNLLVPMWVALFASLGWNFLDYGLFSGDVVVGWVVCGVLFELMALPAVLLLRPTGDDERGATRWWVGYAVLAAVGLGLGTWTHAAWS